MKEKTERICSNCFYYVSQNETSGDCYYNPPTVIARVDEGSSWDDSCRPRVETTDFCAFFTPRSAEPGGYGGLHI